MRNTFKTLLSKIHLNSIKHKIFILFIIISILPLLVLTTINYINSVSVLKDELGKSNKALLVQTAENLDNTLEIIEDKMWSLKMLDMKNSNRYIGDLGNENKFGSSQALDDLSFVMDLLGSYADTSKYIDSIYLYSISQKYLVSSRLKVKIVDNIEIYDWYQKAVEGDGKIVWIATREVEDIDTGFTKQLISAALLVKNNMGDIIGTLCINLRSEIIEDLTENIDIGDEGFILICDEKGNIINHKDKNLISTNMRSHEYIEKILSNNEGSFECAIQNDNFIVNYFTSPYTKWKFATILPSSELNYKIFIKSLSSILVCIACIPVAIFFSLIISNNLYTPIKVLKNAMRKAAEGDFSAKIEDIGKDEFSELNESFNTMVKNIDDTIKELYRTRLLKKEAELKALQSQINPHFLYNTLDSMYWMARLSRTEELSIMISAFSKFLKINLSKGRDIISIKEVIEEIEHYLTIQKYRFGDKFDVVIDVDQELYNYSMIKFIMQPMVENAIYHGIERKKGKGMIKIIGRRVQDHIKFSVIDDGIGMSQERLEQVMESIDKGMEDRNFALVNISKRIQAVYGDEFKINIKSREGLGTEVEVEIPIIRYEDS